ncbi:MAG: aspartyl protease family protein [Pyrinomonadaceae bacterium]|nr:aspartyl protease family protein [Pyrinomonadaceae bacterium]
MLSPNLGQVPRRVACGGRRSAIILCICLALCAASAQPIKAFDDRKKRSEAERVLRNGDFETAARLLREVLIKNPKDNESRLRLSFALLKLRLLQDAFDQAARVLAIAPNSARAHALLGSAMLATGNFQESTNEFHAALALDQNEALAVAGLSMISFYENRLDESVSGLRRAVFLDPNEPDYSFNLAQAAARSERYREAADSYERFLRIAPITDTDRRARIQGLISFLRFLGAQGKLYRPSGETSAVVPFEMVNNRPVMQVRIGNSKEVLRFVVDTGSGMCVVSDEAAKRIGLRPAARGGAARAIGGGGRFEIVYGFLPSLQLGGAAIENVPVYIRQFYGDQKTDGYIGLSVMSKYLTEIDYGKKLISFVRGGERRAIPDDAAGETSVNADAIEIPVRNTPSGFWSGEIRLDGIDKTLNFIIDTGASISVVSEQLATREEMNRFALASRMRVFGAAGITENVPVLLLPRLLLGAHTRQNVPAVVLDMNSINETSGFEQTGIIGGNVLRHFRVTFDFARMVVRLEPLVVTRNSTEEAALDK